jgi:methyltransferase (TIGR00027 family)
VKDGRASWTARRVAAQRLAFARVPADHGRPEDDRRLHADVADGVEHEDGGMTRYLRARTAFVDRSVVAALGAGMPQALLVGAGYDGRALRYAWPGVAWFELDHPDTQADKRARLARLGIADDHVAYVPAEIGVADVPAALAVAGHDARRPTLVVCEGLAPYLPPDVLTGLLDALAGRAAARSTLVLELPLVPRTEEGRARREWLNQAVSAQGEPIRSAFPAGELAATLAGCGWTVRRAVSPRGEPVETSESNVAFVVAGVPVSPAPA